MRLSWALAGVCLLWPTSAMRGGDRLRFEGPFTISGVPAPPVTIHAGDFNKDSKIDLVSSNGTGIVTVLLQDPLNRELWTQVPVHVGTSCFFSRAGDFDGDAIDDLIVADGGSSTYFLRSRGDGTFERPFALEQSRGPRWIALGDWNNDGRLDLASGNLNTATLTIFVNELTQEGKLDFRLTQNPVSGREHSLEALDFDGDGLLDLAVGQGPPGIELQKGKGDGTFVLPKFPVANLGCVEYIAIGDFNNDGKDDLAPTCIDDGTAYVGLSTGKGAYTRIVTFPFSAGTESTAAGDLNSDGIDDLAMVSEGSGVLKVFPGTEADKFGVIRDFAPGGTAPRFLITADLDADGHRDVVSADTGSTTLTVYYGREGDRFLESGDSVTGYVSAKGFEVGDFDRDGVPDLFYSAAADTRAYIYLKPGGGSPTTPTHTVDLASRYTSLAVSDLNNDGVLDLAGSNVNEDTVQVALLDTAGKAHNELAIFAGIAPTELRVGQMDAGTTPDLAVVAQGSNQISLFFGAGDGKFSDLKAVSTIENPKRLALGDLDGDQRTDMVVTSASARIIVMHYQSETGDFMAPRELAMDTTKLFGIPLVADLNGDGQQDILIPEARTLSVFLHAGMGNRTFAQPVAIKTGGTPGHISTGDFDSDGLVDLSASLTNIPSLSIVLNLGAAGFADPEIFRVGTPSQSHRVMDLNSDGIPDLLSFSSVTTSIRLGQSSGPPPEPRFYRGDTDGNARVEITDPVQTLTWLFRASAPLACEDAADANDDGKIDLTDPVSTLNWLFREGGEPAPPGALRCGEDPGADDLKPCKTRC